MLFRSNNDAGIAAATPTSQQDFWKLSEDLVVCKYVDGKKNKDEDNPAKGEMENGGVVRAILGKGGPTHVRKGTHCFFYWQDENNGDTPPTDVNLKLVHVLEIPGSNRKEEKVVCDFPDLGKAVHDDCIKSRPNSASLKLQLPPKKLFGTSKGWFFFVCSYTNVEGNPRTIRSPFLRLTTNTRAEPKTPQPIIQPQRGGGTWTIGKPREPKAEKGVLLLVAFLFFGVKFVKGIPGAIRAPFLRLGTDSKKSKRTNRKPMQSISAAAILLLASLIFGITVWVLSRDSVQRTLLKESPEQMIAPLPERLELLLHDLMTVVAFNEHSRPTTKELEERLELFNKIAASDQGESRERMQQIIEGLRRRLVLTLLAAVPGGEREREDMQQAIVAQVPQLGGFFEVPFRFRRVPVRADAVC